jgi:hypothetical protein
MELTDPGKHITKGLDFQCPIEVLLCAGTSPYLLVLFSLLYGGANGMMTILRGTIVQDVMWTKGYGAISGLLSLPSNIAKGIAPISAAAIWSIQHRYGPVEWMILSVSLVSAGAFILAMRFSRLSAASIQEMRRQPVTSD